MGVGHGYKRLLLLSAFLGCIVFGFGLALVLKDRLGRSAEADPCFGQGELVGKWHHDVTQAEIDSVKGSAPQLADQKPGLTEFRTCKTERGDQVIIDEYGHVFSYTAPTLAELESYYEKHPDENPQNQRATAEAEKRITDFVTPALPAPEEFTSTILAGCDPTWVKKDFPQTNLRLCYPPDWKVEHEDPARGDSPVIVGNGTILVNFSPGGAKEAPVPPACAEPTAIRTGAGDALLCAYRPQPGAEGWGYDMILPIGRRVIFLISDPDFLSKEPSEQDVALAMRVALSAEDVP